MPDILHRVAIKSNTPRDTYAALTTVDGLAGWWTAQTEGDPQVGGEIRFTFGDKGFFLMRVRDLDPMATVLWEVLDGPAEWIGTTIEFMLRQEEDYTAIRFAHRGWKEPVEFMHHCSTKWAIFLMSLKSLIETGKGQPSPNDVLIDNWN